MLLATATVLLAFGARLAWALYSKAHPTDGRFDRKLRAWEQSYNTVRPHQSLAYRTTKQYLRELAHAGKT